MKSNGLCAVAQPLFPSHLSTAHPSPRRAPTLSHTAPASSLKFLHSRKKCEGREGRGLARGRGVARAGAGGVLHALWGWGNGLVGSGPPVTLEKVAARVKV